MDELEERYDPQRDPEARMLASRRAEDRSVAPTGRLVEDPHCAVRVARAHDPTSILDDDPGDELAGYSTVDDACSDLAALVGPADPIYRWGYIVPVPVSFLRRDPVIASFMQQAWDRLITKIWLTTTLLEDVEPEPAWPSCISPSRHSAGLVCDDLSAFKGVLELEAGKLADWVTDWHLRPHLGPRMREATPVQAADRACPRHGSTAGGLCRRCLRT